jgi:plastocyanin
VKRFALCAVIAVAIATAGAVAVQAATTTLKLKAASNGALKYNKKTLRARPGKVTIKFTNPSTASAPHAVEVEGKGKEKSSKVVGPGGKASVTLTLKKGTYEFYCPVGNHKAAGMKGKLIVQ